MDYATWLSTHTLGLKRHIRSLLLRQGLDAGLQDDIYQSLSLSLAENWAQIRHPSAVAGRQAWNLVRQEANRQRLGTTSGAHWEDRPRLHFLPLEDLDDYCVAPDSSDATIQAIDVLVRVVQLPAKQQQVLYHAYWEGCTDPEIGVKWGVSKQYVCRVRLAALAALRACLGAGYEGG